MAVYAMIVTTLLAIIIGGIAGFIFGCCVREYPTYTEQKKEKPKYPNYNIPYRSNEELYSEFERLRNMYHTLSEAYDELEERVITLEDKKENNDYTELNEGLNNLDSSLHLNWEKLKEAETKIEALGTRNDDIIDAIMELKDRVIALEDNTLETKRL